MIAICKFLASGLGKLTAESDLKILSKGHKIGDPTILCSIGLTNRIKMPVISSRMPDS